jgi:hypothetical protein
LFTGPLFWIIAGVFALVTGGVFTWINWQLRQRAVELYSRFSETFSDQLP